MSKLYKNRVCIEIMADIWTEGETEDEAGKASEDLADDLVRNMEHQIMYEDGWPGTDEVQFSTWGVRNIDIEEYDGDDCERKTVIDAVYDQYVHDKNMPDDGGDD